MTVDSTAATDETPEELVHVHGEADLDDVVAENDVVLADFHADWCGPCRMLEPIVETLASETPATVAKIDVDENQPLAAAYGVRGVPTLALFADGEHVETMVGVQSEEQLRSLIDAYAN